MEAWPRVSFIVINYKTLSDTLAFLESARTIAYPNIEIIVVDNNSPSGKPSAEIIDQFNEVQFIFSHQNLGFAGGNNLGIRKATGKYVFLLNNDTLLYPDFLEPIIRFMEAHPDVGMASPKILYPDRKTIQFAGAIGISPFTGRGRCIGIHEPDLGQYDKNYPIDLPHGAALIIPKHVIDQVGLMPEAYFLYYEEHDWCEMVKKKGYSVYYLGESKIIHKESATTGSDSPLKTYYMTRNRLLFMRRNFSGFSFFIGLLFFIFVAIPKNSIVFLVKGKGRLFAAFWRGIWWNMTHLIS
ncbi:MAG: glycosyltransferase family 2 protein [Cyclobacteriaceae bacterium]|nr:glycosyltransferase family 2 protein [Cyclobacteriaceae bacterium]